MHLTEACGVSLGIELYRAMTAGTAKIFALGLLDDHLPNSDSRILRKNIPGIDTWT
jgi:hypothetical protein